MQISAVLIVLLAASQILPAQPVINAIVNAGSEAVSASPGCMESIYGSDLAPSAGDAPAGNLPTTLNGVTVTIGGMAAPIKYVSPGQINFQIPFELTGTNAPVVVNNGSASAPFTLQISPVSPGLISIDPTHALIIGSDFQLKSTIQAGDSIILYAVGLGPTGPPTPTGAAGNSQEPLNRVLISPALLIGGQLAAVSFAGMAPLFPGVYQINATVPAMPLDNSLTLQAGGITSGNIVTFIGGNASNVTGSVSLLYPTSTTMIGFSPVPIIASYSASFDVAANAQPFNVYAKATAGSSTVTVNPQAGTIMGTSSVPTAAARAGNFANSGITAIDFLGGGIPFPGDIIPQTRLDPAALMAIANIPLPNVPSSGATGMYNFGGTVAPGAHVTIAMPAYATTFFGFSIYTSEPSSGKIPASVALFVDGIPVASANATATIL